VEPDPKLDALGDELESLVAGLSQSPQQFLLNPGKVTRLKAMLEEVQSIGKQELDRIVAASQASAEQAKVLMAEMQEKKIQEEAAAAAASQPQKKDWPPDTGGLRLTFWFEKEFTPPEDQTKALTASVVELVQKKKPSVPSSSWKPRQ
jgi:hypothetical protein